ncbi:MAG: nucleotide exchange factor GrpE [Chloroflexi bacterium]|nr:nucleotide exchange factor GrpE [Chloroflexota bacterium]
MTNPPSDDRAIDAVDDAGRDDADQAASADAAEEGATDADGLVAMRAELDQARAQYQRAMADYQNLQRRSQQDRHEHARQTLSRVVRSFLPVLDDLSRALDSVDPQLAEHQWVEGVRLVRQKFWGVLESAGVIEIRAAGERFDPQVHEAVGYAPGDEGHVARLVQAGYALGDHVIRPAMVLVGDGSRGAGGAAGDDSGQHSEAEGPSRSQARDQAER